jgi:hypothetical protein
MLVLMTFYASAQAPDASAVADSSIPTDPSQIVLAENAEANDLISQYRGRPGPPIPRRPVAYPRVYPSFRMASGRKVAIGAAVGFGIGALIGAKASANTSQSTGTTVKTSFLVGAIGSLIGAGIGAIPPVQARNRRYRAPWQDRNGGKNDEEQVASRSKRDDPPTQQETPQISKNDVLLPTAR